MRIEIKGYVRPDGKVGVRNHVLILPTVICSLFTARKIASMFPQVVCIENQHGCCQIGPDLDLTTKVLINTAKNPNVAAVLVVALGCESVPYEKVVKEIEATGKPVELVVIQEEGEIKTIEKGIRIVREFVEYANSLKRKSVDISSLIVGIECGGSDWTSAIAANPAVGYVANKLIDLGATVIFAETTELIGAEHILAKRAVNEEVAKKLLETVKRVEEKAKSIGVDIRGGQPTRGNIEGGITTIEEKSLGAIYKAGTKPLKGVLDYADSPKERGLYFMDTPGQDIESVVGMVAGGAQIILFTTGLGTPTGNPIAPVIKVTGNPWTYEKMKENIDINAGTIILGEKTIEEVGEEIFNKLIRVANGELTKAEILGHREFGIYKLYSTF